MNGRVGNLGECALDGVAHLFLEHHHQQRFLRFGMEEKRALSDVGGLGDLAGSGRLEALGPKQLARGADEALAFVALVALGASDFNYCGGG